MNNNNRPFVSPGPAGLLVLAFYLGCLWPIATFMSPKEASILLVPLGLAGAIVQMTAGIIECRNGELLSGNMMMAFSAFMWYGCGSNLLGALGLITVPTTLIDGWVFLVMALAMVGFTPVFFLSNTAGSLFMICTDLFFLGSALFWLTGVPVFWTISGWALPFIVLTILLQVIGQILNTYFEKELFPMGPAWISINHKSEI